MAKKKPKTEPRTINKHVWYYVGNTSIDLIAEYQGGGFACTHTTLRRKQLEAMLAELPKRSHGRKF